MSEYITKEAKESAIKAINGCVDALTNEPGLPYKLGSLTFDYIVKCLVEYRKIIEKELSEITNDDVNSSSSAADTNEFTRSDVKVYRVHFTDESGQGAIDCFDRNEANDLMYVLGEDKEHISWDIWLEYLEN